MLEHFMKGSKEETIEALAKQGPEAINAVKTLVEVGLDQEKTKADKFISQFKKEGDLTEEESAQVDKFEESFEELMKDSKIVLGLLFTKIQGWITLGENNDSANKS